MDLIIFYASVMIKLLARLTLFMLRSGCSQEERRRVPLKDSSFHCLFILSYINESMSISPIDLLLVNMFNLLVVGGLIGHLMLCL
jgi:hypothetical protein